MPELRKETLHFLNNETVTEADIAEVRRGNVIDIGVSTAAITYMRVNNQGQEELSPTNILKNVSKRKDNLHKVLANVANLSECAGVDVRQRLLDVLRSEAFVANSGKTYPRSKVERSCRRVLLLEPEERRQVIATKTHSAINDVSGMSAMNDKDFMPASDIGPYMPMHTQSSIGSSINLDLILTESMSNWPSTLPVTQACPAMLQPSAVGVPMSPVSAQLASFGYMSQGGFTVPFGYNYGSNTIFYY